MPSRIRVFLLVVCLALPAFAGNYRWTIHGPHGGAVERMAFDPQDSSIVYAATENGLFRSADGGAHWTAAVGMLGKSVFNVAVAPGNPQKVFAATVYGLYGSDDRGATWRVVHGFASFEVAVAGDGAIVYSVSTSGVMRSADGGVTFGSPGSGYPAAGVSGMVIDPANPDIVYVALLSSAGVYKSVDGGANWAPANSGLTSTIYYTLAIDPSNGSTLYAGGGNAIFKTTNGGASWSALTTGVSGARCYALAVSTGSPSTIVAGIDRGFIKSTNGGQTWTAPKSTSGFGVGIDPQNPSNVFLNSAWNFFRSTDGGNTLVPAGAGMTAHLMWSLAVDPRNESTIYMGGPGGMHKSTDRGRTWTATGLNGGTYIAVDGFNSSIVYAVSGIMQRSLNGGATWEFFTVGLPIGTVRALAVDPRTPATVYCVVNDTIYKRTGETPWVAKQSGLPFDFIPLFVAIGPHSSAMYTGGVTGLFKSIDGGDNWTPTDAGIANLNPSGLAIDPFDANHLFTWSDLSAYESTNGGTTWTAVVEFASGGSLMFDPSGAGRVYARTFDSVKRSTDGGRTWQALSPADGLIGTSVIAIAPDGKTIYAGGTRGGVWVWDFGRRRSAAH